ncbi:MAG: anaerobic ribonucleoside-triphosphate reductase activating protein [Peptostreptococcaceae bacterium]|nr:anaerobic ribonucleoside-triphosphate reductase activating protein [Peptostreptococcaceae bacterium]
MRYSQIKPNDVVNGEGVSVSLWTQGCPHYCNGCFNKETWDFNGGKEFGQEEYEYILELINADNIQRNLSILGGEPLCEQNINGVLALIKMVKRKFPSIKVYVWTGYTFEELIDKYHNVKFNCIDVLIDGKFEKDLKDLSLLLRGSKNQRVINISKTLEVGKIVSYI